MTIYVDIAGCLADFTTAALHFFGKPHIRPEQIQRWGKLHRVCGVRYEDFWTRINTVGGVDFWANLPLYPWSHELVDELRHIGSVKLVGSPGQSGAVWMGKEQWAKQHFGDLELVIAKHKAVLAVPGAVLVDDRPQHLSLFQHAGGRAVAVPQSWNGVRGDWRRIVSEVAGG